MLSAEQAIIVLSWQVDRAEIFTSHWKVYLMTPAVKTLSLKSTAIIALLTLTACSSGGLPVGLTARMDQSGAALDHAEALNLVNQFRRSRGVTSLHEDPSLTAVATQLANQYATTGTRPASPDNILQIRYSAGYANFAETFSGWRGQTADAAAIADPAAKRMGLASVYNVNSEYGVHWVVILAGDVMALPDVAAQ